MIIIVVLIIILICVYKYNQNKNIEKRREEYKTMLNDIQQAYIKNQNYVLTQNQLHNLKEMADYVSELLEKYINDIVPKRFILIKEKIQQWINENNFNDLYELYQVLDNTNNENVLADLDNFLKNKTNNG